MFKAPSVTRSNRPISILLSVLTTPLVLVSSCLADQFVLFDVTFPFTQEDANNSTPSKSHFYVSEPALNPQRPKDWTAPVDYRNGTVHVRLEIIYKPEGGEPTTWTVCYIPNRDRGQGYRYGCFDTKVYKEKGVYNRDIPMTAFGHNDDIIWAEGIKRMDLVLKDSVNLHAHKRPDPEKFFPTKVRMTLVQVSAGAMYDPSLIPNLPIESAPKK